MIDYEEVIKPKKGSMPLIEGECFHCRASSPQLAHIPLILKRLQCIDRRIYDFKVYEADQLRRIRDHPNLVTLYSFWSEKSNSPYVYKVLVLLLENTSLGTLDDYLHQKHTRDIRFLLKCAGDVAKALLTLHTLNIIHGGIKPSAVYMGTDKRLIVGELSRAEMDVARQTKQLVTNMLLASSIPDTLMYWAPELFRDEVYSSAIDMWALGVMLYKLATQKPPFRTFDEASFSEDLLSANVDWEGVVALPELEVLLRHLLVVDPRKRWDAKDVLSYIQSYLIIDIQRCWRGCNFPRYRRRRAHEVQTQADGGRGGAGARQSFPGQLALQGRAQSPARASSPQDPGRPRRLQGPQRVHGQKTRPHEVSRQCPMQTTAKSLPKIKERFRVMSSVDKKIFSESVV